MFFNRERTEYTELNTLEQKLFEHKSKLESEGNTLFTDTLKLMNDSVNYETKKNELKNKMQEIGKTIYVIELLRHLGEGYIKNRRPQKRYSPASPLLMRLEKTTENNPSNMTCQTYYNEAPLSMRISGKDAKIKSVLQSITNSFTNNDNQIEITSENINQVVNDINKNNNASIKSLQENYNKNLYIWNACFSLGIGLMFAGLCVALTGLGLTAALVIIGVGALGLYATAPFSDMVARDKLDLQRTIKTDNIVINKDRYIPSSPLWDTERNKKQNTEKLSEEIGEIYMIEPSTPSIGV